MARSTKTRAQRARLVSRWRASGRSQAAFARQQGLHPRTFWGWCRATPEIRVAPAPARFLPVQVVEPPSDRREATGVEILLITGERVRVASGTAPAWVAAVIAALRPSC
jgi:hypothetical protein